MEISQHRSALTRLTRAIARGQITLGFIGGSITDGRTGYGWPEATIAWFCSAFPGVHTIVENAAIGATGSELACFRAKRDLIDHDCDLVFVEYAVNDSGETTAKRRRTREGLIRQLLAGEGRDIVLTYTFCQPMYDDMLAGRVPDTIAEFEDLGKHYGIGSVWMGLNALREVQAGQMRWEEWLPDGIHPQHRGSLSYAQAVTQFLRKELIDAPGTNAIRTGDRLPAPMDAMHWENARPLPFAQVKCEGPWTLRRWPYMQWAGQVLETAAVGAKLSFTFQGRALSLGFDFGRTSAEFRYRLDDRDWETVTRDRPSWCGDSGWFRITSIADDLPAGEHRFELEVIHGNRPDCTGTNFRLALIGVVH